MSYREVEPVLSWLGACRPHQVVWNRKETLAGTQGGPRRPAGQRLAVDEKQIGVDGDEKWVQAAIERGSKMMLEVDVFSRGGTGPGTAFFYRLTEKRSFADTNFLVDAGGSLTALARCE